MLSAPSYTSHLLWCKMDLLPLRLPHASTNQISVAEYSQETQPAGRNPSLKTMAIRATFVEKTKGHRKGRRSRSCFGPLCAVSTESKSHQSSGELAGGCDEFGGGMGTLYDLLGISQNVTLTEVKAAYRQLARRYHPDVCSANDRESCIRKFMEVQEAYETLSDPMRRAMYDHHLLHPPSARRQGLGERRSWQRGRRPWEAFRNGFQSLEEQEEAKKAWRPQWEGQLQGLKQRAAMRQAQKAAAWQPQQHAET